MKKILLSLLLLVSFFTSGYAGILGPDDLPTISALISLHKAMAKAEDWSVKQVGTSYGEQQIATNNSSKFCQQASVTVKEIRGYVSSL